MTDLAEKIGMSRQGLVKLLKLNGEKSELITLIKLANAVEVHPFVLLRLIFDKFINKEFVTTGAIHLHDATGFISDVTIPDGMTIFANAVFVKTWQIQNVGSVAWTDRILVCVDEKIEFVRRATDFAAPIAKRGLIPTQGSIPIPETLPGQSVELSVQFTAPVYPGTQISYWKMVDSNGKFCFPKSEGLSCVVKVITI